MLAAAVASRTVQGRAWNPQAGRFLPFHRFLKHLESASLAMDLLCIDARLQLESFRSHAELMADATTERLLVVTTIAFGMGALFGLSPVESGVLLLFSALPNAQTCYVMPTSMKSAAATVASVMTMQTLATHPVWTFVIQSMP